MIVRVIILLSLLHQGRSTSSQVFFIKNSNEQANRNFRKYSYFRLSKHNKTDHPFKSQKNSYKKRERDSRSETEEPFLLSQTNDSSSIGVSQIESRGRSDREDQGRNGKRKAQAETNKPDGENWSGVQLMQRRVLAADANADWTAMPSESSLVDL